jgi:hypothetical protein
MSVDWALLPEFYVDNLRSNFFAGFLTLGTFLFAVKTFIVVKLKEDVFDTDFYRVRLKKMRSLSGGKKLAHYAPLKNLTGLLFYAALSSLVCAVLQATLGLIERPWCAVICILSAIIAVVLLFFSLVQVKRNLDLWLEELEKLSEAKEIADAKAEAETKASD